MSIPFIHQQILLHCKDQFEAATGYELPTRQVRGRPARVLYVEGTDPQAPQIELVATCKREVSAPAASVIRYYRAKAAARAVAIRNGIKVGSMDLQT